MRGNVSGERLTGQLSGVGGMSGRLSGTGGMNGNLSTPVGVGDYNRLTNKPSINGEVLRGDKPASAFGVPQIYYGTTAQWNAQVSLIAEDKTIYIYTDYKVIHTDGGDVNVPAIKIGDGSSYLIDMPFINGDNSSLEQALAEHTADSDIHVTPAEKAFWNSKHKAFVDNGQLIFTEL